MKSGWKRRDSCRRRMLPILFCIAALCLAMLPGRAGAAAKEKKAGKPSEKEIIQSLEQKYRDWFDFVTYIIHPTERKIFLELTNDRDRDIFIDLFWSLRDPSPGTPENEFREEHLRRYNYANYYFKFGAGRPGWMTDMGRIYILLGEPDSKDRYDVDNVVNPCQLWSYSGKGRPGLPNAFWVIFFKRGEVGEYRVYNPLTDGPWALLKKVEATNDIGPTDYEDIYEAIAQRHDILAMASVSLLPDEPSPDYRPTINSELLLGHIYDLPQRSVNPSYATNFLKYKGIVKVDFSINYIENVSSAHVLKDPASGLDFIHFAVMPKAISIDYVKEKDKYFFNFRIDVSLRKDEQQVFSYQKNFPFYLEEEEAQQKFGAGVVLADYLPVAVGDYELRVLVQNDVKKEFTYFERKLSVKPESQNLPAIFGPMLSYEKKSIARNVFLPFKVGDIEWAANPRSEFGSGERIFVMAGLDRCRAQIVSGCVVDVEDLTDVKKYRKEYRFDLPADRKIVFQAVDIGVLPPGNYRVRVRAVGSGGTTLLATEATFMVSMTPAIAHPSLAFKITPAENVFLFQHIIGYQYLAQGNLDAAEAHFEKALQLRSDYAPLVKDYCTLLQKKKEWDRMLAIAEGLKTKNETLFDYYAIRGKAFYYKGIADQAIENLLKANSLYDSSVEVLNLLGLSYLKTGDRAEARKALAASLKVFPDQKEIAELLKKIE